ncbi:hypothetical protein [Prosthecobacter sp.]|uniref:hypothetical protein n=1 Tax=Prosthecobacter sp. TaxID=1965333 RepID=UPI002488C2D1|nr:hypothetical protein [Prosthecobacter sp.]MDI1310593.1 hypothetical protein [Prosthecobacter sp.]
MVILPETIAALLASGRRFELTPEGGVIVDAEPSKVSKRAERNRRYYQAGRLHATENVLNSPEPVLECLAASKSSENTTPLPLSPSLPLSPQTPLSPAHPHTPTPAYGRAPAYVREADLSQAAQPLAATQKPKRRGLPVDDAMWLAHLAANPAYQAIDIPAELGKCTAWCELKQRRLSRVRLLNWLNKADRSINLKGLELPIGAEPHADRGTQAELEAYAAQIGLPASDGTSMFNHWAANGWVNGQTSVKDWRAGLRKWRDQGWLPSQKVIHRLAPAPPTRSDTANLPGRYA